MLTKEGGEVGKKRRISVMLNSNLRANNEKRLRGWERV
jgi:hypothetical protein